jgi:hypothetical protein
MSGCRHKAKVNVYRANLSASSVPVCQASADERVDDGTKVRGQMTHMLKGCVTSVNG